MSYSLIQILYKMNNITLTFSDLSVEEVNVILAALQELPAKICNPLSAKLRQQAEAQLPKQEELPS